MKTLERNTDRLRQLRGKNRKSFSVIASIEDRMLNGKVRGGTAVTGPTTEDAGRELESD